MMKASVMVRRQKKNILTNIPPKHRVIRSIDLMETYETLEREEQAQVRG